MDNSVAAVKQVQTQVLRNAQGEQTTPRRGRCCAGGWWPFSAASPS